MNVDGGRENWEIATRKQMLFYIQVRDCNYYKPVREEVDRSSNLVWLHLTPPPTSFFCDTEPYRVREHVLFYLHIETMISKAILEIIHVQVD